MADFFQQTDLKYLEDQKRQGEIKGNSDEIKSLEREAKILIKKLERTNSIKPRLGGLSFTCMLNTPTLKFETPNIFKLSKTCIQVMPHYDFVRFGKIGSSAPALNYLFNEVYERANPEDLKCIVKNAVQVVQDERDSMILLYGDKGTSKRDVKNYILKNIFEMYKKTLLKNITTKADLKLTVLVKDYETKVSELWLKADSYEEQIHQLTHA